MVLVGWVIQWQNPRGRTVVNDVQIENHIGDALVERIIRAHQKQTPWKCCVMIPLLPGFTFPVDHPDASAVRMHASVTRNSTLT